MKILIVSSAPTAHCGIARYAAQQATVMRQEGHTVDWASCDGGTEGVGQSTTRTVVLSSILILIVDYFLTQILLSLFAP